MKTLVAYFSHDGETYFPDGFKVVEKGNAKIIAEKVKELTGGELFEIKTIKDYPVSYKPCCDEAKREQEANELPELKHYLPSIDEFDRIILTYPCWWGTMPQAVFTFLKKYDFAGKIICPICTHEGSKMGRSEKDIALVCPTAAIGKGLAILGSKAENCDEELSAWLN